VLAAGLNRERGILVRSFIAILNKAVPIGVLLVVVAIGDPNGAAITETRADATAPTVLEKVQSLYNGELAVLDYQGERYLIAQSRQERVLHSAMDLAHKERAVLRYTQILALLTRLHPQPDAVYNLGLGGGALARFHLHEYEKSHVDSAEIDPSVVTVDKKYFDITNPRHKIFEGEGFDILQQQTTKYDVIWVDDILSKKGPKAFIPASQLKTLQDRLNPNGIIVANLGGAQSSTYFSEVEQGYHRGYSHAIRIKSPFIKMNETLDVLVKRLFPGKRKPFPRCFQPISLQLAIRTI
jgi:predicted membrane-bound spermidine synthase